MEQQQTVLSSKPGQGVSHSGVKLINFKRRTPRQEILNLGAGGSDHRETSCNQLARERGLMLLLQSMNSTFATKKRLIDFRRHQISYKPGFPPVPALY